MAAFLPPADLDEAGFSPELAALDSQGNRFLLRFRRCFARKQVPYYQLYFPQALVPALGLAPGVYLAIYQLPDGTFVSGGCCGRSRSSAASCSYGWDQLWHSSD